MIEIWIYNLEHKKGNKAGISAIAQIRDVQLGSVLSRTILKKEEGNNITVLSYAESRKKTVPDFIAFGKEKEVFDKRVSILANGGSIKVQAKKGEGRNNSTAVKQKCSHN